MSNICVVDNTLAVDEAVVEIGDKGSSIVSLMFQLHPEIDTGDFMFTLVLVKAVPNEIHTFIARPQTNPTHPP